MPAPARVRRFAAVGAMLTGLLAMPFAALVDKTRRTRHFLTRILAAGRRNDSPLVSEAIALALENMSEGLVMYDGNERLVMCNRRYAEIYLLTPELARVGTSFSTLLRYWTSIGLLDGTDNRRKRDRSAAQTAPSRIELNFCDGRIIELNERSLPGGGWVATHEDITDRRRAEKHIHFLAHHDPLTGLLNRVTFGEELAARLEPSLSGDGVPLLAPIAVVLLDLDRFKKVNDLFGHAIGDSLLVAVAGRAREVAGPHSAVARLGGDEFAILMPADSSMNVRTIAEEIVHRICRPYMFGHIAAEIGVSIGIAYAPEHGCEPSRLLARADRALYTAKSDPDNRVVVYTPALDARDNEHRELVRDLARAITADGLDLVYQPIVSTATRAIHGAEALLRWNHPRLGPIAPERIIAIAEESGLIHSLGEWILVTALAAAAQWPERIGVSVNLSALQFRGEEMVATVESALARSGVLPQRLELEVTETVLCAPEAAETMKALRGIGVHFALDDFGTGYASLSYLTRFPFDRIKIDRSFVAEADQLPQNRAIIEAVADLAASLRLQVVAEGVETEAERNVVRSAGCRFSQGWLFGRPVSNAAFHEGLRRESATDQRPAPTPTETIFIA